MQGRKKLGNFNNKATSKKNVNKKCKRTVRTKLQKRNGRESQTQCYFRSCAHDKEQGSTSSTFPHRRREKGEANMRDTEKRRMRRGQCKKRYGTTPSTYHNSLFFFVISFALNGRRILCICNGIVERCFGLVGDFARVFRLP